MTNLDFFLNANESFADRTLEALALEPIALFEQYEPINETPAPAAIDDAYENLYLAPT